MKLRSLSTSLSNQEHHLNTRKILFLFALTAIFSGNHAMAQLATGWKAHDKKRPAPKVVDPGEATASASVPSDAIVLFDGKDLSNWNGPRDGKPKWLVKDGVMESVKGAGFLHSKEKFGDCQLHIEWTSPTKVKGNGQGRGNSGVFLPGGYEIQVLDSFESETYADGGAASITASFLRWSTRAVGRDSGRLTTSFSKRHVLTKTKNWSPKRSSLYCTTASWCSMRRSLLVQPHGCCTTTTTQTKSKARSVCRITAIPFAIETSGFASWVKTLQKAPTRSHVLSPKTKSKSSSASTKAVRKSI